MPSISRATRSAACRPGRIQKSIGRMIDAQNELDRLLAQARQLSETVGRVVKAHAEREKRGQP